MSNQNHVGRTVGGTMKSQISILVTTCQIVGTLIPLLLRLGLIGQSGCVVLGAMIGIVVAVRSKYFGFD